MTTPPIIDDRVEHVTTTFLRSLNAKTLKELKGPVVIHRGESGKSVADATGGAGEPLAVIIPYAQYLEMQEAFWPASFFDLLERVVFLSEEGTLLELMTKLEGWTQHAPPSAETPKPATLPGLPGMRLCIHCNNEFPVRLNVKDLCSDCFVAGHRSGNCMKCAEAKESL